MKILFLLFLTVAQPIQVPGKNGFMVDSVGLKTEFVSQYATKNTCLEVGKKVLRDDIYGVSYYCMPIEKK